MRRSGAGSAALLSISKWGGGLLWQVATEKRRNGRQGGAGRRLSGRGVQGAGLQPRLTDAWSHQSRYTTQRETVEQEKDTALGKTEICEEEDEETPVKEIKRKFSFSQIPSIFFIFIVQTHYVARDIVVSILDSC